MLILLARIRFVPFNTNLCLLRKPMTCEKSFIPFSIIIIPLLLCNKDDVITACLICDGRNVTLSVTRYMLILIKLILPCCNMLTKQINKLIFSILTKSLKIMYTMRVINTILLKIILNIIPQIYHSIPIWVISLLIIMSNDIELNPGDNKLFTFCNWNLNSLTKDNFSRLNLLEVHNLVFNYDIISLCETHLNNTVELPSILLNGFKSIFSHHPSGNKRGGVALFYKENLPVVERNDLSFNECIVIEIHTEKKNIFLTVIYRSPHDKDGSPEFERFLNDFENLYIKIKNENPYAIFFTGDFNAHSQNWWPDGNTNNEGIAIDNLTSSLALNQIISEPTNFEENKTPSCIDLIFCDQPNIIVDSGVRPSIDPFCKHQITYCNINLKMPSAPSYTRKIWKYSHANTRLIRRTVSEFPWHDHLKTHDPNWQVNFFNETILNIMSNFIPNNFIKILPKEPPWITTDIKRLIKKQNRFYKKFKRNGCKPDDKVIVDNFRNECFDVINKEKEKYLSSLGQKLNDPQTGPKAYWKVLNKLLNKSNIPIIPPILHNNKLVTNFIEKSNLFNKYFVEQCKTLINDSVLPPFYPITNKKLADIEYVVEDLRNIIHALNSNKSHGPDNISIRMLQICGDSILDPLDLIFRNIIKTGIYPDQWKLANVTPVHKKDNKQSIRNYRPISLLPICAKLFERILFNNIYNYLISNNLITENQSGFKPGDSTTNQLLYLTHIIHSSFDINVSREVRHVFLDISKAFDKVWHEGLLFKLKQNGITGSLITLLASYLNERKQRVLLNGYESVWGIIESGVPQGSVLGPLLFLIYINDLENGIQSKIKFFADDTSLFSIVNDSTLSAVELNHDLNLIENWAHQWKMSFNPDPNKQAIELLCSHKNKSPHHPPLYFNNKNVSRVTDHKHLGLILDSKLSFSKHISEKISTARKGIGIIKYMSAYAPVKTLDQIYKMFVRPHLDYCDIIYHLPTQPNPFNSSINLNFMMQSLESTQYQAALAVSGAWKGSNTSKLYEELGWESLSDRRWFRRLCQFYKIHNDLTPSYLKEPIPQPRRLLYGQRRENVLHEIPCRTLKFYNSFYPDSVRSWNNIGFELRNCETLSKFKLKLLSLIRPPKKTIFGIHDPFGIKILFQLRLGLSSLKSHKKRHKFLDTPSEICECGNGNENTIHFFTKCARYATNRTNLLRSTSNILIQNDMIALSPAELTKLYLYGHTNLSKYLNCLILQASIKYIHDTERFKTIPD